MHGIVLHVDHSWIDPHPISLLCVRWAALGNNNVVKASNLAAMNPVLIDLGCILPHIIFDVSADMLDEHAWL